MKCSNSCSHCKKERRKNKLTPLQNKFISMTPVGVWLTPSPKGYKKYGVTIRTLRSLKQKGYIDFGRKIGMNFESGLQCLTVRRLK